VVERVRLSTRDLEVASNGVLAGLSQDAVGAIGAVMTLREIPAGDVLVREGEAADALYVLLDGRLAISLGDGGQQLGELEPGAVVGEVAVLSGTLRTATATATTAVRVGVIERADLATLTAEHPEIVDRLLTSSVQRLRRSELAAYLSGLFGAMPPQLFDALVGRMQFERYSGGNVLFRPGDPSDAAYIVLSGRLRVITTPSHRGAGRIEEIGRRQPIGWAGLLTRRPRNQTVVAIRDSEVARLDGALVAWFTTTVPQAGIPIMAELADRMERAATAPLYSADRAATFAVIASPGVDGAGFASSLAGSLALHGRVLVVGSGDVHWIGGGIPPHHYLDEREASNDFVVYVTDPERSPWTEQCLRQADHILVVGDATGDPAPGPVEASLSGRWSEAGAPRRTLVLLQDPAVEEPRGTGAWLDPREVDQHLHIRRGNEADLARAARLLSGRAVTLVLGGGGARGYAHIGVIRAMEELGIPIDMVAGTSMGAIVGAVVARGRDARRIEAGFAHLGRLLDVTLPLVSISSGVRINRALVSTHGDVQIEDTWLPFFCVSTNITQALPVIHRRGSLARALRASSSLPGILPPVYDGGSLLIDGGLLDTLPVGVMHSLNGGGRVIAVDVSPPVDVGAGEAFPEHLSGWRVLWNRLRRRGERRSLPGIGELLQRTVAVPGLFLRGQLPTRSADLLIQPQLGRWGMLDLDRVRPIAEAGYAASLEPLREWWAGQQESATRG
jgi:predicted acylesterase/phospholipase RssA/CRP-like cAMP-binding protein